MNDSAFTYESTVRWQKARRGVAVAQGRSDIAVGAPPEFHGTDDVWSPEHLTIAAVNTCMMLTFIAIAENSKLSFLDYVSTSTGRLEKTADRGMHFTAITVHPRITVPADTNRSKLDRVLEMTKKNCFISNSLVATVALEAEIVVG